MYIAPVGTLSVMDFAEQTHTDPDEVLVRLQAGRLAGRVVGNDWFVERDELIRHAPDSAGPNQATAIMLAAANMNWREILGAIEGRLRSPIKADTPEHGLDIDQIHREAKRARDSALIFDGIIGFVAVIGIAMSLQEMPHMDDEGLPLGPMVLTLLTIALVDLWSRRGALKRARAILRRSAADGADPSRPPDRRNVNISGGYSPFVGAGVNAGGWSFTVNLTEPEKAGLPVEPTLAKDLYAEVAESLRKLAIPGMVVKDEAFVDGRDVRALPLLTPGGPYEQPCRLISTAEMQQLIGSNDYGLRHYKVIRLELWAGQIILSFLFRYVIVAGTLYVEAKTLILPPLKKKFSELQNMPILPQRGELMRDIARSVLRATVIWVPVLAAAANYIQGGFLQGERGWRKANKKEIAANQKYNYGWATSLREAWAGDDYNRYFQMADEDFYSKLVKETLLDSLLKSLERRNVSTAGMKDASTRIYNEGVIVNGGTVIADSIAAGTGAKATVTKALRAAAGAASKAA